MATTAFTNASLKNVDLVQKIALCIGSSFAAMQNPLRHGNSYSINSTLLKLLGYRSF